MKKLLVSVGLIMCCLILPVEKTSAQIPIMEIIRQAVTKVIVAVDLKVQRLQNKTIWLQNAQKTLENTMSKLKLDEIRDWVEKQRKLYADYFDELRQVKAVLAYYGRVHEMVQRQVQIVNEYKAAWALFRQDQNFTTEELDYMYKVYNGILDESLKNIDQLFLVINAFTTQMSDAKRLEIMNAAADGIEENYFDLKSFNDQNKVIALQRASERGQLEQMKKLYGL
jgi:hypothetical protein